MDEQDSKRLIEAYTSAQINFALEDDDLSLFMKISGLQCLCVITHVTENANFISVAINLGQLSNTIGDVRELISIQKDSGLECLIADDYDNFFQHISGTLASSEIISALALSIDQNAAIVFRGSVETAGSGTLTKLPTLIKGMASLSPRQFRVGIIRLGTSIVIVSLSLSGGSFLAWKIAQELQTIGARAVQHLSKVGSTE